MGEWWWYPLALALPILFLALKPVMKKLIAGPTRRLAFPDFYLGVDFVWASLAGTIAFTPKAWRAAHQPGAAPAADTVLLLTLVYALVLFVLLFIVMYLHQQWESIDVRDAALVSKQHRYLFGVANTTGMVLMAVFVLLLQRV